MPTKQLTLGSLFDGIGGWQLAAIHNGIKPVFSSEIEAFPLAVTKTRFPNTLQLGDVTKINGADIPPVDIICAGSPCFVAGTMVHTTDGVKHIEDIVDDWVLTEDGTYRHVDAKTSHESDDIYELKAQGLLIAEVTGNHPILVKHMKRYYPQLGNGKRGNRRTFSEPEWVQVKDLKKGDFVAFPIIKEEINPECLTEEEAWLIGRYIADGYINNKQRKNRSKGQLNHKVILCIGKSKVDAFKSRLNQYHACIKEDKTAYKCEIISDRLMRLCKQCGSGAGNKEIPGLYLRLPLNILDELIKGYMSGDGCYNEKNRCFSATTISRKLALSLQAAVHKVLRVPVKINYFKRPSICVIEGRIVNQHDTYMIRWFTEIPKQSQAIVDENYIWQPIRNITKINKMETVYNLEVDEIHSYCANGIVVHNCQNLSVAGNRKGLEGTESRLFYDAIRIVREMRMSTGGVHPRFFVWENVPGALSSNKGMDFCTVLELITESEIPMPKSGRWAEAGLVRSRRCDVGWRCLDAQYFSCAQRRKRIFLVADFATSGRCTAEILFERKGVCRDFAESEREEQGTTEAVRNCTPAADGGGDFI